MEKDNCSQVEFQQILNKIHSDLSKHGEFGKNMSKCIEDRTRKMLLFQTQIARFNKLLEHDEQEIQENELVELCAVINKEFGIGLNAFTIQLVLIENYLKKLHKLHLQTNMQLYLAVCEYLKLLESLTVSETYIERIFSYLGRSTENNKDRDSLKMKTFESLCYLKVNSTLEEALKKLAMENNEEEV
ncbi:Hypothetical_protein [Hexamita inflata]|uniref:Hypothetical_protein n=1 Tax=Hexamita inflata TaxID=28002 RepID=A0ABP1GUF1_9EUKA